MRKALMALVSVAGLGALAAATPAAAMGGDAREEQAQLYPSQPGQARYGAPAGKVYYAQAPAVGGYVEAPVGGYVQPSPPAGAIEPPSGAFTQTLGAMIGDPFEALVTPYQELLGQPAL
jgi:hypothetical protein